MSKSSKMKKHNNAMREAKANRDKRIHIQKLREKERLKALKGLRSEKDLELIIKHGLI